MNGTERGLVVQARDRRLLEELSVMRVIDREQAAIVGPFASTTRVNARLLALTQAGLLRRFFLGTAGSGQKALYALSLKGAQYAAVPLRGPRRRKDELVAADFVVQHQLTVNELYCTVKYKPTSIPGVTFRRWVAFHEPILPGFRLVPDGYAEWQTPAGVRGAFLEIDLGHEGRAIWTEKVKNYLQFADATQDERRRYSDRFRVLVIAPSDRRLRSIRTAVLAKTQKTFWFGNLESIRANGFFAPIWFRPTSDERRPFITR